ncbi:MAG TPA: hypothetical protein VJM32_03635 [Candidatus Saccharimonadales bacterium]|nr:hypothetical protein [Candidatus Saccharimonadales bacterium]
MKLVLHKVRLSWFFFVFFVVFMAAAFLVPQRTLEPAALTLFSVNSFLFGFYIAPVLGRQSTRIDELGKAVRAESIALFDMLLRTKTLRRNTRNKLQDMFETYMQACLRQRHAAEGEEQYEALIGYCLKYEGDDKETVDKILNLLIANQQNRSNLAMQLANRVYSNEWWIMLVLFGITMSFVLFLKVGTDNFMMTLIKGLLCTGLSMLMINLLKLSTLTHKKAKSIWDPLHRLVETRFYRID